MPGNIYCIHRFRIQRNKLFLFLIQAKLPLQTRGNMAKSINNQLLGGDFSRADFFNHVQKYLRVGFWYFDSITERLYFGKKILAAMGFQQPQSGISLENFFDVIHVNDRKTINRVFRQLFNKRKSVSSFEVRFKHNDDWRWVRSSAVVVDVDANRKVLMVIGKLADVDISKYKRPSGPSEGMDMQPAAYQQQVTYEAINRSWFPYIVHNGLNVCWVNRRFTKIFGYCADELLAENGFRQLFVTDSDRLAYQNYILSGEKMVILPMVSKIGQVRMVQWAMIPTVVDNEIFVMGIDVTKNEEEHGLLLNLQNRIGLYTSLAQKFANCTTNDEYQKLYADSLVSVFPKCVGIAFSFDTTDNFATVCDLIGLTAKRKAELYETIGWNPIGRRFHVPDEFIPTVSSTATKRLNGGLHSKFDNFIMSSTAKAVDRYLNIGEIYISTYNIIPQLFGGIILLRPSESPEVDLDTISDFCNMVSITPKRLWGNSMGNTGKSSICLAIGKSDSIVHEIITPSNSILGYVQLLTNQCRNNSLQLEYLNGIKSANQRLQSYANSVYGLVQIEEGNLTLSKSKIFAKKVFDNVQAVVRSKMDQNKLEHIKIVSPHLDDIQTVNFYSDEGRIEQIVELIVENILQYIDRGIVTFEQKVANSTIQLVVIGQNIDIDPNSQCSINERFQNQESNETDIGLKYATRLIELLNGKLEIQPGYGSQVRFVVEFSLGNELKGNTPENEVAEPVTCCNLKNKVILIAEDEAINYRVLKLMVEGWGATTIWAKNGREAVDLVTTVGSNIDLILMDIRMPEMNGYAATMEIRQINPNIPIIAQTAFCSTEDKMKAEAAGCNGFIAKPIDMNKLAELLGFYC